jgi:teichuronic acid biosynthesis glycosyltransferase TuaG
MLFQARNNRFILIAMNSLVSIITPSYNAMPYVRECIESVLAQSYQQWEMIIVDDCSSDGSAEYIANLIEGEPRIRLIALQRNVGAAEARNTALSEAKGRFIAFLDSDDIWLPQKLERQLEFMRRGGYAFTFSSYTPISEDGAREYRPILAPTSIDYQGYLKNTIIGCLTVMIDRRQSGDFRMPDIRSSHDMALWLEILHRGFRAYGIREVLAKYRLVSSSNTSKKLKAAGDVWRVYRDVRSLPLAKSLFYWMHYIYNAAKKRL